MNRSRWYLVGALALFAGPATANPAPSAAPSEAPPPRAKLAESTLPAEPSPPPKLEDWKLAKEVDLASALPEGCSARLLREWLKVRCDGPSPAGGAVLSGPSKDVAFFAHVDVTEFGGIGGNAFVEVIMPLRRGERRIVQLTRQTGSPYEGFVGQAPMLVLSQRWLKTDSGPLVHTDHQSWKSDELFGMRIGGVEEAKALGLKTAWGPPIVLEVAAGSLADRGGAKPGDHFHSMDWVESLALGEGSIFTLMILRNGGSKNIQFPRRRTGPP
jgi:hypothetical protein